MAEVKRFRQFELAVAYRNKKATTKHTKEEYTFAESPLTLYTIITILRRIHSSACANHDAEKAIHPQGQHSQYPKGKQA